MDRQQNLEIDQRFSRPSPPINVGDPRWDRRRAFLLADRASPEFRIEQLDGPTFAASLLGGPAALQSILGDRVRLKWFVDGHCAAV